MNGRRKTADGASRRWVAAGRSALRRLYARLEMANIGVALLTADRAASALARSHETLDTS